MDFESALITERLQADVALHSLFAGRGRHKRDPEVVPKLFLHFLVHVFAGSDGEGAGGGSAALSFALCVAPLATAASAP